MTSNPFGILGQRRRHSRTPRVLLALAVFALLVGVYAARGPLGGALWGALGPVVAWRNALSTTESAALRGQVAELEARLADRNALYEENLALKSVLGRAAGRSVTLAAVLQRPPGVPYDTLLVDAGKAQGIVAGSYVSLGGSALVGTVAEVYADHSRVELFSAPGLVHNAVLTIGSSSTSLGASKQVALSIEGQGGGSMRAQVPAGIGARVGDTAVMPGIGMGLVATVAHVRTVAGESFETIYFALPANLNARFVEIWQ